MRGKTGIEPLADLRELIAALPDRKGAFHLLQNGVPTCRPYSALHADVVEAAATLKSWGVTSGTRVAIFARNSYPWVVHDLAVLSLGAVLVPFTEDFRGRIDAEMLDRYGISLLLTSRSERKGFAADANYIGVIDGANATVSLRHPPPADDASDSDCLTRVFSSGSSGGLKGLVISRMGVITTLPPLMEALQLTAQDRLLLFLPLSNFQQRYLIFAALWKDFDIILTEYTQLFTAMVKLNPTILLAPPVFYEMVFGESHIQGIWKRRFRAIAGRLFTFVPGQNLRRFIARKLFPDFYNQFGNSIRLLITGMAPVQHHVLKFFYRMQIPISEAFGMVEVGVMTYRQPSSRKFSSVGKPLRDVRFSFSADGELIAHRPHFVTSRYFQCAPGENENTFIGPNAVATGDLGYQKDGYVFLNGRKKEVIVTSGGLKIHPEVVEQQIDRCAGIAKSVVFSTGPSAKLNCVVLLNDPSDGAARQKASQFVAGLGAKSGLPVLNLIFASEPFTRENGLLRPNMKIDRRRIAAVYKPSRDLESAARH